MDDNVKEKLIAKLQLEYSNSEIEMGTIFTRIYEYSNYDWDFGLLYITNKNLWFVNTQKEKTKVPYNDMLYVSNLMDTEGKRTKYSDILKTTHMINLVYKAAPEGGNMYKAINVLIAGPKNVLNALRTQVTVRAESRFEHLYENWLNRKLSTFMYLNIRDEEKLAYFLNISNQDLLNLILKRSSYFK